MGSLKLLLSHSITHIAQEVGPISGTLVETLHLGLIKTEPHLFYMFHWLAIKILLEKLVF